MILPFELDPQIIHHIIYSQAGSIGKAIIELLMNSVDANATFVRLTLSKDGFYCIDDGRGFASRDDVLRYFGRFGTPHEEGDATYGRFRLGRGQIMAHASTVWQSNSWQMTVDTREMGYSYDLEDISSVVPGCTITGKWYEALTETELMSAVQEVRDLVRYTPVSVELNGKLITRDPRVEKWDHEDEFAYYRAKEDGSVAVYNQGVLVRHDAGHVWGIGGLIVSKKAIGLNVSRTEILRKTCPVWKAIAKQFGKMAEEVSKRLGDHRKTEARREKCARALLSGGGENANLMHLYTKEEVITVLPGKRHITLSDYLQKTYFRHKGKSTIVENGFDVPKGEAIAREGIMLILHPQTLQRFGCNNTEDFRESLERIVQYLHENKKGDGDRAWDWFLRHAIVPEFVAFSIMRDEFVDRTSVISEKTLDKETRRAWTALRWCLQQYAGACSGARMQRNGRIFWEEARMHILLGDSNNADAWTDGKTYLAFDRKVVDRLKAEPMETAAYIFALAEHELAHEGDSMECGHDEAFYQRYHDISIKMSPQRQRYIHMWLMKLTTSMESAGKKSTGRAWRERYLVDRAGSGREKRGQSRMIDNVSQHPVVTESVPPENMAFINMVNFRLVSSGRSPLPPNWDAVIESARRAQEVLAAEPKVVDENEELMHEHEAEMELKRERYAAVLGIKPNEISWDSLLYLYHCCDDTDENIIATWAEISQDGMGYPDDDPNDGEVDGGEDMAAPPLSVDEDCKGFVQPGETQWSLERNAAAAGFYRISDYLKWRSTVS